MGPLSTWEDKLKVTKDSGYNMIHFTPVQVSAFAIAGSIHPFHRPFPIPQHLGGSNSAYSLRDQHCLNPTFECDWDSLEKFVSKMRRDWNVVSICDIVLNHTANETEWIMDNPDATYNCKNCPHLRPAYILDRVISRVAADIEDGKWIEKGIPKGKVAL